VNLFVRKWYRDTDALAQHLGAEYFNIGRALADGRGFSDPFGERTGSTAWMPPLYPAIIAALLLALRSRALVGTAILGLTNVAWVGLGVLVYRIARRCAQRLRPELATSVFFVWICLFHYWTILLTHDIWLVALGAGALAWATYRALAGGRISAWVWGSLGGLLALISPSLAFAWAVALTFVGLRPGANRRACLASGLVALAIAAPWAVRNALVFHRAIPVKSNLGFDAYQGSVPDGDGVYDIESMSRHPFGDPRMRFEYAAQGEMKFIDDHRDAFVAYVRHSPVSYLRKVGRRLGAALLAYPPVDRSERGLGFCARRVIYSLPLLVLMSSLWIRGPNRRLLTALAVVALAYLAPYVLFAFYIRYLLPLTPVLALIIFLGCDQIAWRLRGGAERRPG
jgi:hypothetical protein